MGKEMLTYLQQLELLAFFSGYPLVYAFIASLRNPKSPKNSVRNTAFYFLPISYAIIGVLYIGLLLRNFYPNYSFEFIKSQIQIPFFVCWAFSSLVFFLPWLSKKPVFSILHSLVFFFLILKNFYKQVSAPETDTSVLKNYMKIYITSIVLNITILAVLLIIYYSIRFLRRKPSSVS